MKISRIALSVALAAFTGAALGPAAQAQSRPTEKEIIEALTKRPSEARGFSRTRSFGKRGVTVTGEEKRPVPSIDLKVTFAFDSARLDNDSMLTLDVLGRALSSEALKGQAIEIVGHTDAKGTLEYNDALSDRRAAAVVGYIVRKYALDRSLISWKGMGERQLLDPNGPEAAINRRVEIRNVTHTP